MTYEGFLSVGGVEVVNTERARGYATSAGCPSYVVSADVCEGLRDALASEPYVHGNIATAPWYDRSLADLSGRFYGAVGLTITGVADSTRTFSRMEGVTNGGTNGRSRKGMRSLRVTATLLASGDDALDYGSQWLSSVFDGGCGQHADACDMTDAEFLATCPIPRDPGVLLEEYSAYVDGLRRYVHDVAISGPLTVQELAFDGEFVGRTVEFTISSERAWVYGKLKQLTLAPSLPTVMEDTPFNRVPYPSAELGAGSIVVATNLSANPSVEASATGWSTTNSSQSGPSPTAFLTSGRSTELAAVGSASYRVRLLGDGGTTYVLAAVSEIIAFQDVAIPAGTSRRISLNLWAAAIQAAGTSPNTLIQNVNARYLFLNGGTAIGATTVFGSATSASDIAGSASSLVGLAVPDAATIVRVSASARVTWTSAATPGQNSDIRLFADALQVSIP
ncbi:minor tail protein [Microbacterium phage Squash]|uniref:Minor tail protein n=1 Tax=Microbacterium phage Squash TaxID=2182357 RepID=A0A2U8UM27_9CAUD|nr:minor tail protein [Microbacterium phage Squash]AWN04658.1 minor tail protein [Microbacterium phage Squash]QIQ63620.1 minor tail protein [Microbacterium phage Nike]